MTPAAEDKVPKVLFDWYLFKTTAPRCFGGNPYFNNTSLNFDLFMGLNLALFSPSWPQRFNLLAGSTSHLWLFHDVCLIFYIISVWLWSLHPLLAPRCHFLLLPAVKASGFVITNHSIIFCTRILKRKKNGVNHLLWPEADDSCARVFRHHS